MKMIIEDFTNKIFCADCLDVLPLIPDNSIDLVLTSPPYDQVRDYNKSWKIDLPSIGQHISRILANGGICALIIQDQTQKGRKSLTTFKTIVDWCDNTNLDLWECCIYNRKGTPGPWWAKRFRVDHEYIPIFIKGYQPQYFDKESLKIPCKYAGQTNWGKQSSTRGTNNEMIIEEKWVIADTKCRGTIWNYDKEKNRENILKGPKSAHPAFFPDKLANDIIRCFTKEGMIVCDPMCGSGTSCVEAKKLGRNYIGIDICKDYCELTESILKNASFPNFR